MNPKKINKTKYVAVFATTTLIFIIGLLIGNFATSSKLSKIDALEQDLKTHTMSLEMQYLLLAEDPCMAINSTPLINELYDLAQKLDYMENKLGANNLEVLRLKEYYSLLQLRHWLLLKKTKIECHRNNTLILYFYSNIGDCSDCEEQGFILSYLKKKDPLVNVYSFDININNLALDTVKELYGIGGRAPVLVIDDKPYFGFKTKKELEGFIAQ